MKQKDYIIEFAGNRLGYGKVMIDNTEGFGICRGITAVYGRNGAGKTTLGTILDKGRHAYGNRLLFHQIGAKVKMLSFTDIHSLSGMEVQYFAQRMESTMNDLVPTVADVLGHRIDDPRWQILAESLALHDVVDKKINYLSSGELRKLIIVNALLSEPDILVLDNPYIGLDAVSRIELDRMLLELKDKGISIVLLLCDIEDIPAFTDSVITLDSCKIVSQRTLDDFRKENDKCRDFENAPEIPTRPERPVLDHEIVFEIKKGHVRYGDREILKDVDWIVRKGERWALTGRNGSGKSLLLSMICADNPQAYANDIILFDRRRGSGESIWEIKDAIGYVSPEMQLFFKSGSDVTGIVGQGLRNALNRYSPLSKEEIELSHRWLEILGIHNLADRNFNELSAGEQRLVLVVRAMIRQPELLVLDEPFHGLDAWAKSRLRKVIDMMTSRNSSSMIFVTHYKDEIPEGVTLTKHLGETYPTSDAISQPE